jgi:hypothetical protein
MHKNKFDRNLVAIATIAALWSTPALYAGIWGNSVPYDNGLNPKAATDGSTVVEVHNGWYGVGPLWYRVGQVNTSNNTIQWGNSIRYDNGLNPSVAISGWTVVEVHNAIAGVGPLWMRIGQVDTASNTIKWGNNNNAFRYDNGMNPSVAIYGSNVVEVHNAIAGVGPLWMRIGQVDTASNTIKWGNNNNAFRYDNGMNPSVAIYGSNVVEVHNGTAGVGPLWYRVGQFNISNNTIQWGNNNNAFQYDNGLNPTVAFWHGLAPVEVHNGGYGVCPLWYHVGYFTVAGTINWGASAQYDNGMNPCVAASPRSGVAVEVHDGVAGAGPLWYRVAYLSPIQ